MGIVFAGFELKNHLVASSSPLTESLERIKCCYEAGFAAAILKSAAAYKKTGSGHGRKVVYVHDGYYADASFEHEIMTIDEAVELYASALKHCGPDMLLIPSVSASSLDPTEWINSCCRFEEIGSKLIQLDFFYLGTLSHDSTFFESLETLLCTLKHALKCNVMPKINNRFAPHEIFRVLKTSGISAVSLLDSMREDPDPALGLHKGTTSYFGPRQFPYTLEYLRNAKQYGLEVCAGGGVSSRHDIDILLAEGANLVQIASYILNRNYEGVWDLLESKFDAKSMRPLLKHNPWCDVENGMVCENCGGCAAHNLPVSHSLFYACTD